MFMPLTGERSETGVLSQFKEVNGIFCNGARSETFVKPQFIASCAENESFGGFGPLTRYE
jgi:hypothetical protein